MKGQKKFQEKFFASKKTPVKSFSEIFFKEKKIEEKTKNILINKNLEEKVLKKLKKIGKKTFPSKNKKIGDKKKKKTALPRGYGGLAAAGGEHPGDEPADAGESSECRLPRRSPLMG